jgi:hypothetical protein
MLGWILLALTFAAGFAVGSATALAWAIATVGKEFQKLAERQRRDEDEADWWKRGDSQP